MYRILSASKDAYITDKIIDNNFRAKDANVGTAGTIDLFKLYAESTSGSDVTPTEISRGLIKFDLAPLRTLMSSTLDINHNSFKCTLKLHDVYGGQTTPNNFKMIVFPLSKSFDEGIGKDVVRYSDLDSVNFITASVSNGTVNAWNSEGAMMSGSLGSEDIDVIVSGTLQGPTGTSTVSLSPEQTFTTGKEDLEIDITTIVSATLSSQIIDHGFLVAYSGSFEKDTKTYFVKRFASRHVANFAKRPKIIVKYDDSIQDNHRDFIFDVTGSLFLNNFHRGQPSNIISGTAANRISGSQCMHLLLTSGAYSNVISASQHKVGKNFITGVYSASFAISQFTGSLLSEIRSCGSASFTEIWSSIDGSVGYHTGSTKFVVNVPGRSSFFNTPNRILATITNLQSMYKRSDNTRIRVYAENRDRPIKYTKLPLDLPSEIFSKMYYRVRDFNSSEIIIPFDSVNNSTLLSTDSEGMFFDFYMDSLPPGRAYVFEFLIQDSGFNQTIMNAGSKFIVKNE